MNKNKGGRPRFVIDYEKLDAMCRIQCTEEECAAVLGCNVETLAIALKRDKNSSFPQYFKKMSAGGKVSLRRRQYKSAVEDGNVTMLIWLGKQYLGQKDTQEDKNGNLNALDKLCESLSDLSNKLPS